MTNPIAGFDFRLLDDPDFREDSVREELIVPLLAALGYSASQPHRIIRGRPLTHPFVYIGSAKKSITIIPDYILERDGKKAWILDAKAPNEILDSGKNAQQAYSYAIHPEVRVPVYALCNGRRLVAFNVSEVAPILDVSLEEIEKVWPVVLSLLGSRAAWPGGLRPGFLPDLGVALWKAGLAFDEQGGKPIFNIFTNVSATLICRLEDDLYSITAVAFVEDTPQFMVTFDFGRSVYDEFLSTLPEDVRKRIASGLTRQPFKVHFDSDGLSVAVAAEPGARVIVTEDQSYCPFTAVKVF